MKRKTSIYVLIDPTTNLIRYVGKTVQKLNYRLTQHLSEKSNHKRSTWIKSLRNKGFVPVIKEIDSSDWEKSSELEKEWIEKFRFLGEKLTNMTDGGDGTIGVIPTKEQLKLRSEVMKDKFKKGLIPSMLGKTHTKEAREKISRANKGIKRSDSFKEKRRKIMLGTKRSKSAIEATAKANYIPIVRFNLDFTNPKKYNSLKEAVEDGFTISKLIQCLKGRTEKYRGFRWFYFEELPPAEEFKKNPKLYEKYI